MDGLTIHEASETTGWSARMLRYIEQAGLVSPGRTASGYRIYGPAELQRLRTLKELLNRFGVALSDVAFAARLESDTALQRETRSWLNDKAKRPDDVEPADWLRFEQDKHERLLRVTEVAAWPPQSSPQAKSLQSA
jgi:MerR family copper efflux transcriptional regulator